MASKMLSCSSSRGNRIGGNGLNSMYRGPTLGKDMKSLEL